MAGSSPSLSSEDHVISNMNVQLAKFDIRSREYPHTTQSFRRAAVLLPITVRNGEIFILLTKRSKELRTHPSAVSFPGGSRDDNDTSDIDTALREAEEEIGLPPTCVKILAVLNRGITLPNIVVYPVVGLIPSDFQPNINTSEVETAFYVPLKEFLSSNIKTSHFKMYGNTFQTQTLTYKHGEEVFVIYGFTAIHCVFLACIIFDKNADAVECSLKLYFDHISQHVLSSGSKSRL